MGGGGVTVSENAESDHGTTHGHQANTRSVESRGGGVPWHSPIQIHIRVALYMWFCDYSEWWGVWVICSTLGGGFGVVGGRVDIHIGVCISLPVTKGCVLLPPRFALKSRSP